MQKKFSPSKESHTILLNDQSPILPKFDSIVIFCLSLLFKSILYILNPFELINDIKQIVVEEHTILYVSPL
jgi:hypothetical protein